MDPWSPELQADSLLSEPPAKPKNTGVGSLSLLLGKVLTQESNQGLLHCRRILYQLSYLMLLLLLSHLVVSDSVRPHRRQPTRLPCPWDSPGKNTGVGCHFLLQCMKVKSENEVASVVSDSLRPPWTAAYQASLPMGFSRQEYWSGVPSPSL